MPPFLPPCAVRVHRDLVRTQVLQFGPYLRRISDLSVDDYLEDVKAAPAKAIVVSHWRTSVGKTATKRPPAAIKYKRVNVYFHANPYVYWLPDLGSNQGPAD